MKSGQVTLKDLAKQLGISPSTVSRALKDHPDISQKTKRNVAALAEKLNYEPNSIALSLRSNKSYTIGVIIPEIVHFFFSSVISGIESVAYDAGYNVILCQSNESFSKEVRDAHALTINRVDGLLVSLSRETTDLEHFRSFQEKGLPLILFDRVSDEVPASQVIVDDEVGAYRAVCHLIEQGCTRILHLAGPPNLLISKKRKQGYLRALEHHGIPASEQLIQTCNRGTDLIESGKILDRLLKKRTAIDGIFANNDLAAIGAMNAVKRQGLRIPGDVAIVGYSNWQMAELVEPSLSSVHQPGFEMGQAAAQLFVDQVNSSQKIVNRKVVLETELVVRESSMRKPAG